MTVNLRTIHPALAELIAACEAFRRLGFPPEEIFVTPTATCPATGKIVPAAVLRAQGLQFVVTAPVPYHLDFEKGWTDAIGAWNTASNADCDFLWFRSSIFKNKVAFLLSLYAKGFKITARNEWAN